VAAPLAEIGNVEAAAALKALSNFGGFNQKKSRDDDNDVFFESSSTVGAYYLLTIVPCLSLTITAVQSHQM
jgi:hypothetical protein